MKKYFAALSATALLGIAPQALAASTTDLTVTGTITPSACMPTLSNGGRIDHGTISSKDLNQDRVTPLIPQSLTMTVTCDAAILFALNPIDNQAGSSLSRFNFGLGLINGNQKLGEFAISVANAVADTVPVLTIASNNQGNGWFLSSAWNSDFYMAVNTAGNYNPPIAVKDLSMDLEVATTIARADRLDLSDDVSINGSVTFEMKYL